MVPLLNDVTALRYTNPNAYTGTTIAGSKGYIVNMPADGQTVSSTGGSVDNLVLIGGDNSKFIDEQGASSADHIVLSGNKDLVYASGSNVVDVYGTGARIDFFAPPGVAGHAVTTENILASGINIVNVFGTADAYITGSTGALSVDGKGTGFIETAPSDTGSTLQRGGTNSVHFRGSDVAVAGGKHAADNQMQTGAGPSILDGSDYGINHLTTQTGADTQMYAGRYADTNMDASKSTGNNFMMGFIGGWTPSLDADSPVPHTEMHAGSGNDTLVAGAGTTIMYAGQARSDTFSVFYDKNNQVPGHNIVQIVDFKVGLDRLIIHNDPDSDLFAGSFTTYHGGTQLHLGDGTIIDFTFTKISATDVFRG